MYENSVRVARIMMMVATVSASAVVGHVKADEWPCFSWYVVRALYAV
jgi:hypothetical protein